MGWRNHWFTGTRHDYGLHCSARLSCSEEMVEAEQDSCAAQAGDRLRRAADVLPRKPGYNIAASQKKSCTRRQQ